MGVEDRGSPLLSAGALTEVGLADGSIEFVSFATSPGASLGPSAPPPPEACCTASAPPCPDDCDPMSPPLCGASAPPPMIVLSEAEFQALMSSLQNGCGELPSPSQLRRFRSATNGRMLWTSQMRELAEAKDGGAHLFREAYERQLLADPQELRASDGPWVQALWALGAMEDDVLASQAAQALARPMTVLHHSGRLTTVAVDHSVACVGQALDMASKRLSDTFDPCLGCSAFVAGASVHDAEIEVGRLVRVTGLVEREDLNGKVGQVTKRDGDMYEVALPTGVHSFCRDNLMASSTAVNARNGVALAALESSLEQLGHAARLLWLSPGRQRLACVAKGPLRVLKAQFLALDLDGDGKICAGELRNFLWNLHLSDAKFSLVWERFAPGSGGRLDGSAHILVEDLLFLLGRSHVLHPQVPVDALIYEAVVSILGRRTTAHIDKDLSQEDKGVGCASAFCSHWLSYCFTLLLQIGCLVGVVLLCVPGEQEIAAIVLGVSAMLYLLQVACCVRLTSAFWNKTEGMDNIMSLLDRPRLENPHYTWRVQCYHYVTRVRTETTTGSDGKRRTRQVTRRVRVNTHSASASGTIPSTDMTPAYLPQTAAAHTQIHTALDLDLTRSNYRAKFEMWTAFHRRDVHQDRHRSEDLPSRKRSVLAVWRPDSRPWWMTSRCYWFSNLCCCSLVYRWAVQAQLGEQTYTYHKRCFDI